MSIPSTSVRAQLNHFGTLESSEQKLWAWLALISKSYRSPRRTDSQQGIDYDTRRAKEENTHGPNKLDVTKFDSLCHNWSPHVREAANGLQTRSRIVCRFYSIISDSMTHDFTYKLNRIKLAYSPPPRVGSLPIPERIWFLVQLAATVLMILGEPAFRFPHLLSHRQVQQER